MLAAVIGVQAIINKASVMAERKRKDNSAWPSRVNRRKNEPVDLFAIRAYVIAMPHMTEKELIASINYLLALVQKELDERPKIGTNDD